MNLLVLLSVLLSALTGVSRSTGAADATQAVAGHYASVAVQADVRATRVASRPQQGLPTTVMVSAMVAGAVALTLVAIEPAYASRRRE